MAYHQLLKQQQDLLRKQKEDLDRRKEAADLSSIRRVQLSSMRSFASRNTVTGAPKRCARVPDLNDQDRDDITRNLGEHFIEVDPVAANLAPKTPEAAFAATAAYILANPPPANDPRVVVYKNALAGLGIVEKALPGSGRQANNRAVEPRQQNRASP